MEIAVVRLAAEDITHQMERARSRSETVHKEGFVSVLLDSEERAMLDGQRGKAVEEAMSIIVQMANATGASELVAVEQAHIDACALMAPSNLDFVSRIVEQGGQVAVPTTLNMVSLDLDHWRELQVPPSFANEASRIADAYLKIGCIPTWTCAPYQGYLTPRYGQQIAWGESNAIVYANSVLGARTNRYADYLDVCAAISGRVPNTGLHRTENRRGEVLIRLPHTRAESWESPAAWAASGHFVGERLGSRIPVIDGLPKPATTDQLKAFGAAAASAGAIALFHAVGITPEAPDVETAFHDEAPREVIDVSAEMLGAAWDEMSSAVNGAPVDTIILGCPHFSFDEFRALVNVIEDLAPQKVHENVQFQVITHSAAFALAERGGLIEPIRRFGAKIIFDTCPFHSPIVADGARVVMTNSGKAAYYAPGELGVRVAFGSLEDCVLSSTCGHIQMEGNPWQS